MDDRKHYDADACKRKADQYSRLARMADRDHHHEDAVKQRDKARVWDLRADEGGWTEDD